MAIRTPSGHPDPTANAAIKKIQQENQVYHLAWTSEKGSIRKDEAPNTKTK